MRGGAFAAGPRFYPADQVTDLQTRFIVAELIREAALHTLRDEVPHALAVVVTEFTRRHDNLTYIGADLILERKSHKQIVIGEKGKTLKQIGQLARPQIEEMIETKVYLELWVKVRPKWRANPAELRWLGYSAT
jgi:GTP-binding protein Era